jgi:hypothetical protein
MSQFFRMSKVQEIRAQLEELSPKELEEVRGFLDSFMEDKMEFTAAFEVEIRESEGEMIKGVRPRVRKL